MRKLLFVFVTVAFTACGPGSTSATDSTSVSIDTAAGMSSGSSSGALSTDSIKMSTDSNAMSTPR